MKKLDSDERSKMTEKCKSPKTLKLLKSLRLFVAITPLVFLFGGCSGWGWFVPYSFQPSYHKFKKMCELDEDIYQGDIHSEEYYNKVLAYFDTSLDKLDWDELNEKIEKLPNDNNAYYKQGIYEYMTETGWKTEGRIKMTAVLLSNESKIDRYNINAINFIVIWYTRQKFLETNDTAYNFVWREPTLDCRDIKRKK